MDNEFEICQPRYCTWQEVEDILTLPKTKVYYEGANQIIEARISNVGGAIIISSYSTGRDLAVRSQKTYGERWRIWMHEPTQEEINESGKLRNL